MPAPQSVGMRPERSEYLPGAGRGMRLHVRHWDADPSIADPLRLVMLHGWMDVSASFQFVADALGERFHVIAPDLRGFGLSDWPVMQGGGDYGFHHYLADLDALLDRLSPATPVNLIGHSLGGNIALHYAGVRPRRVRRLVTLEGYGLAAQPAESAPDRLANWLDQTRAQPPLRSYADLDAVAARLRANNPRLDARRAAWIARHLARPAGGRWHLLADAAHRHRTPRPYRLDEVLAIWHCIEAPVLRVDALGSNIVAHLAGGSSAAVFLQRFDVIPDCRVASVADAGHMLHHDQPDLVARLLAAFCAN